MTCAGADTMHDLAEAWAREFGRRHPGASVRVRRDAKLAAQGMDALADRRSECALMVREPFPAEIASFRARVGYAPTLVNVAGGSRATKGGTHAIAIYVNETNPLRGLTLKQLDGVFSKTHLTGAPAFTNWGELGLGGEWAQRPIHVYGMLRRRDTANPPGIVNFLERRMLAGGEFRDDLREEAGSASESALDAIVRRVAEDPAGIGFSGFAYARPGARAVALARSEGEPYLAGSADEVASRRYPLARDIYIAIHRVPGQELDPVVKAFLCFVLTPEGQRIVAADRMGFLPLDAGQAAAARENL
jgi:phosphate transport system substrate-binding protein